MLESLVELFKNPFKYFRSINKESLVISLSYTSQEIQTDLKNIVNKFTKYLNNNGDVVSTSESKKIIATLKTHMRVSKDIDVVNEIIKSIDAVEYIFPNFLKLMENTLPDRIDPETATPKQAAILEYIRNIDFFMFYTYDVVDLIVAYEIKQFTSENINVVLKAKVEEIKSQLPRYGKLIRYLVDNKTSIIKSIEKLPDIEMEDDTASKFMVNKLLKRSDRSVLELLNIGKSNFVNLFYNIGFFLVDIRIWYYNYLKERKRLTELKLMELKSLQDGEPDPKLEKQIEYYEEKVKQLEMDIRDMENFDDE